MSDAHEKLRDELLPLLVRYCEGDLTDAEFTQLEETLRSNPAARAIYIDHLELHARLAWDATRRTDLQSVRSLGPRPRLSQAASFFTRPTPFSFTVAALVMLLLITTMAFMVPPYYRAMTATDKTEPVESLGVVAELTGLQDAVWAPGQTATDRGAFLLAGRRMELVSGVVLIEFRGGARVAIEGPAEFVPIDAMRGQLQRGKLTARVPAPAVGFAVMTPAAEVVDLGTEFGLQVDATQRSVVKVFEGAVEVNRPDQREATSQRLTAGQSIAVTRRGFEPIAPNQTPQFVRAARFDALAAGGVIADARRDFRAAEEGNTSQFGDRKGIPATGNGVWNYYRSDTLNPADTAAGLELLTYGAAGTTLVGMYHGDGRTHGMPAISGRQIFNGAADGAPRASELAIHPGDGERGFAVVRWTADEEVPRQLRLRGRVRLLGNEQETDGVIFAIFAAGAKIREQTIAPADNRGVLFDEEISVVAGQHVDFVIGRRGNYFNDQTGFSVVILANDNEADARDVSHDGAGSKQAHTEQKSQ